MSWTRRSPAPARSARSFICRRAANRSIRKGRASFRRGRGGGRGGGRGVRLLCGRFEGIDERVLEARAVEELSLGDFVLSGGEPAAIALIDACVRLLPGVVGCAETLAEESFAEGLLEYPHFTRPQVWQGRQVPEVLVSGDPRRIGEWRRAEAERLTRERRPDLWRRHTARQMAARPREEVE